MLSKKAVTAFALLGATAWLVVSHWGEIRAALGLGDPVELRAVRIAKSAFSLATHSPNHQVVQDHVDGIDDAVAVGWQAVRHTESLYLVSFVYEQSGRRHGFYFEVDVGSTAVRHLEPGSELAEEYRVEPLPAPHSSTARGTGG
jgi:hypothetical protein